MQGHAVNSFQITRRLSGSSLFFPGGGKTTQVKILAGEIEPTAGEVVKSSKDLRVAFLRQEFVDELVMERSLKEELTSVFVEETTILDGIAACEVSVECQIYPTLVHSINFRVDRPASGWFGWNSLDDSCRIVPCHFAYGYLRHQGSSQLSSPHCCVARACWTIIDVSSPSISAIKEDESCGSARIFGRGPITSELSGPVINITPSQCRHSSP